MIEIVIATAKPIPPLVNSVEACAQKKQAMG